MAAYTQCLRCAGAPRRPAGGSGLSLPFLLGMPLSMTPGSSIIDSPELRCRHGLRRVLRLGTPNSPAIRFTRARISGLPDSRICYGLPSCSPPVRIRPICSAPEGFYFQASNGSVALPVAGYDYNSDWTPLLAGLSPAEMAASLAAPEPSGPNSGTRLPPWVFDGEAFPFLRFAVCAPARVTRLPGSESGACFAGSHSPWPPPLAPPAPRPVARLCSSASQLLWQSLTSRDRASSATAPRLPDADRRRLPNGRSRDLPVPAQRASAHARFFDHAGSTRRSRWRACSCCLPYSKQRRHPDLGFRGSMAGLCPPLPTLRRRPRGRQRTARGRCRSLLLHRSGLAPPTPCRSPGALRVLHAQPRSRSRRCAETWMAW